jgi:hypothetical protein
MPAAAAGVGIFPAGQRQARMELPALLVFLQAGALLDAELAPQLLDQINDAVTAGATAVVLDGSDSAAALYEAAVKLKELLRGRAALLLLDRLDIAAAVGAEGVVLSPTGALATYAYITIAKNRNFCTEVPVEDLAAVLVVSTCASGIALAGNCGLSYCTDDKSCGFYTRHGRCSGHRSRLVVEHMHTRGVYLGGTHTGLDMLGLTQDSASLVVAGKAM